MNDREVIKKIYKLHIKNLQNTKFRNKRNIVICFFGVPASGKTTIAKKLEKKYKAVRFSNDEVRKLIKKNNLFLNEFAADPVKEALEKYRSYFLRNYSFSNTFLIFDASIDRNYQMIKRFANRKRFDLFIIRLKLNKNLFMKRIREREQSRKDNWIINWDRWLSDFKKSESIEANLTMDGNSIDLKKIYKELDHFLKLSK